MSRRFSLLISWGCIAIILITTIAGTYLLFNINGFSELVIQHINLNIDWSTVTQSQWYIMCFLTLGYLAIGLLGLYFLHLAFANIAAGELFNLINSLNLRRFSILLLAQAIAKPIYHSLSSVILSLNHPAGEKVLSVSFGSHEIMLVALALVLWVLSDLLVVGCKLQSENRQFI